MTTDGESIDPQLLSALEKTFGDYIADVAELLLTAGYPIGTTLVDFHGIEWTETPKDLADILDEGRLVFPFDIARRFGGGNGCADLGLYWSAISGWNIGATFDNTETTRWMNAGLNPNPKAVVDFFTEASADILAVGHPDRRLYRRPGTDLPGLMKQLRAVVGLEYRGGTHRIRNLRRNACWSHASRAILTDDARTQITVTGGELKALQHLVDYYVARELDEDHLRGFAVSLVRDLQARAATKSAAVPLRAHALAYARRSQG
ncbi:hypothetical protein P3T35_007353 [Kitasatospora sp. GP30]|uniref:hypothetical protein n=1 Tax=Kitasatospora sp. GP30 TaxID=3035084 RepID=UPI000C706D02|nr:hypothetical protein [Kitasatospora sp. GP30]MDH6145298.1 hypothetical protein [Kitasatospora sp. GP30]